MFVNNSDMGSAGLFMAIDRGNTRLKATVMEDLPDGDCRVVAAEVLAASDIEGVLSLIEGHGVDRVAMVAVGGMDVRMVETLRHATDGRFMLLTPHCPLPIRIGYATPETLGGDRVAAVAGAAFLAPGRECVVADAGTALTIDLLTADGCFAGGSISPGLRMRFDALHDHTSALPAVVAGEGEVAPRWGVTTREAILGGVVGGMTDQLVCSMRPGALTIITGGDAAILYDNLQRRTDVAGGETRVEPHLVAFGLRHIYNVYEKEI